MNATQRIGAASMTLSILFFERWAFLALWLVGAFLLGLGFFDRRRGGDR